MAYLTAEKKEGCILCEKHREARDRENLVLYRGRSCYIMLNLYPYNTGHLMIAPYRHAATLSELDAETLVEIIQLAERSLRVLRRALSPAGFNLGMNIGRVAGAGIADHIHLHIVPRWEGDTNFMPILAGTKVLPETLDTTYDKLLRAWREEEAASQGR